MSQLCVVWDFKPLLACVFQCNQQLCNFVFFYVFGAFRVGAVIQSQSYLRYSVGSHLVAIGVQVLNLTVVSPLVGDVERRGDGASVGVDAAFPEQIGVQLLVEVVHGIVERQ